MPDHPEHPDAERRGVVIGVLWGLIAWPILLIIAWAVYGLFISESRQQEDHVMRHDIQPADISAVRLSSLTTDSALQHIFRRLEDDGAVELLPTFKPRPSPNAATQQRELVEA